MGCLGRSRIGTPCPQPRSMTRGPAGQPVAEAVKQIQQVVVPGPVPLALEMGPRDHVVRPACLRHRVCNARHGSSMRSSLIGTAIDVDDWLWDQHRATRCGQ